MRQRRIGIIGAGLTGLTAGRALARRGAEVRVFDKGRRPGGRIATRAHPEPHRFDLGAQAFTGRDERFRAELADWQARRVVAPWTPRRAERVGGRLVSPARPAETVSWVGTPGMRAIALDLARGLDVRSSVRVAAIRRRPSGLALVDEAGADLGAFDVLGVTAPAPQTAPLVAEVAPALARAASTVDFAPTWTLLLAFDDELPLAFDRVRDRDGPLRSIVRDGSKPGRPPGERFVVHAGDTWSRRHLDAPAPEVETALVELFFRAVDVAPRVPAHRQAHRWRHATPEVPQPAPLVLRSSDGRLAAAGDWTAGARVEDAYRAGLALAEALGEGLR